ncbi:IclR family transcriptional regulator [Rhizobium ruizarguesonis]|uniref:IclR family transcriptional regulator n=4 Tax=Rhizobium TaxID=379 RepID=A0AAE8TY31_9HYPH|nr:MULTISPECIES: IclR family transcriptional regulator [Rhizobium]NEJ21419.1 helix-turn-helix domain-containing protein [Rhizobium leguminosarum]MCB2402821.1 IclR family transcriptional regulator [Rhizobium ruizarguesonis]NEH28788.1 helix-turn-helix domain-containing protein [Rhizobium ruizarguesonis]NEH37656.1 helix-turn-helix domain-containing protein [Rhizobium ruizarguesonis]NEH62534.1 helix-turn-helix domain-containing protein [Rhizobium ruizarguesonis]
MSQPAPKKAPIAMRTVDKAFSLLSFFTISTPEFGLSDLARRAELDKATTLRILVSLTKHGFVEQDASTKRYRLGTSVLRFARIREACFPIVSVLQPIVDRLALDTSETAHAALAADNALMTIAIAEPQRSTRVFVDPSQLLPFHATASGLAYLAFAPPNVIDIVMSSQEFAGHTELTLRRPQQLKERLSLIRERGFAIAERSFETEVIGIAAPIFDSSGYSLGALAVASVASRMSEEKQQLIVGEVLQASIEVTRSLGSEPNPIVVRARKEFPKGAQIQQ